MEKKAQALAKRRDWGVGDIESVQAPATILEPIRDYMRRAWLAGAEDVAKGASKEAPKAVAREELALWNALRVPQRDVDDLNDAIRWALKDAKSPSDAARQLRMAVTHWANVSLPRLAQSYLYMAFGDGVAWAAKAIAEGRL